MDPLTCTVELDTYPLPVNVIMVVEVPATTVDGLILLIDGTGFTATTVKIVPLDVPPPGDGLTTVTVAVAALLS